MKSDTWALCSSVFFMYWSDSEIHSQLEYNFIN